MTSWGPGFVQKKGHSNLAYYHQVGFESYATEYFKMIRSILYAQDTLDFLFIFDKVNSYSSFISLFEQTLKKNAYIRHLPYYPSQGYNIADRTDLLQPIFQRGEKPNQPNFFKVFSSTFQLQDVVVEKIHNIFLSSEIPFTNILLGVCILPNQEDFTSVFNAIRRLHIPPHEPMNIWVDSKSRDDAQRFFDVCPSSWNVYSMWKTIPNPVITEEQKRNELYSSIGSLKALSHSKYLVGSHQVPSFRFVYCLDTRFHSPSYCIAYDSTSFSFF